MHTYKLPRKQVSNVLSGSANRSGYNTYIVFSFTYHRRIHASVRFRCVFLRLAFALARTKKHQSHPGDLSKTTTPLCCVAKGGPLFDAQKTERDQQFKNRPQGRRGETHPTLPPFLAAKKTRGLHLSAARRASLASSKLLLCCPIWPLVLSCSLKLVLLLLLPVVPAVYANPFVLCSLSRSPVCLLQTSVHPSTHRRLSKSLPPHTTPRPSSMRGRQGLSPSPPPPVNVDLE